MPLSPPMQMALGFVLIVLGLSFLFKAYLAGVQGRLAYWSGFIPLTIISPFFVHVPPPQQSKQKELSLIKCADGLWVMLIFGPVFFIMAVLMIAAGADLNNWPGTQTVNTVLCGGKSGQMVTFDKKRLAYSFPIVNKFEFLKKIFGSQVGLSEDAKLYPDQTESYDATVNKAR